MIDEIDDDFSHSVENRRPSLSQRTATRSQIHITQPESSTVDVETNTTTATTRADKYKNMFVSMLSVLRLCETLPRKQNFKLFFDSWFSSSKLLSHLLDESLHSVCTLRVNKLDGEFESNTKEFNTVKPYKILHVRLSK
jgi:hypothetical protein